MRTQMLTATAALVVLALVTLGDVALAAEEPPSSLPRAARRDAKRQELLDALDTARIDRQLLEMEVDADARQLQEMMTVLRTTELQSIQGFSNGPIIAGSSREDQGRKIALYTEKLDSVRVHFVSRSKELGRVRRRIADLEDQLHIASTTPAAKPDPTPAPTAADADHAYDVDRILDLILRGVAAWGRVSPPPPLSTPRAEKWPSREDLGVPHDADGILDWMPQGIERSRRPTEPKQDSETETRTEKEKPRATEPQPVPAPEEHPLKMAERLLGKILREVDRWQGR